MSFAIILEAAILNSLTNSWIFFREMSVVEFCYVMKPWYSSMVIANLLSLGFTIILLMTEAVVRRCFSKKVFLKMAFRPATLLKRGSDTGFLLWNLQNTSGGCFWYDSETYNMVKLICLLILISFQFKLHMILINLIKVNHLTYRVQEKNPKIKRFQYVKSYLFICLFSNNMN